MPEYLAGGLEAYTESEQCDLWTSGKRERNSDVESCLTDVVLVLVSRTECFGSFKQRRSRGFTDESRGV